MTDRSQRLKRRIRWLTTGAILLGIVALGALAVALHT